MDTSNTKQTIIEKGASIIHLKGYNNTGIQEILTSAGIPKGSFYFYFKSKEDFCLHLVDYHADVINRLLNDALNRKDLSPINRLMKFFNTFEDIFNGIGCRKGCPIGNLTLEMSDISEPIRAKIKQFYNDITRQIARCLSESQAMKEIPSYLDIEETSEFMINSWQGAIMNMKLTRSTRPLAIYKNMLLEYLNAKIV